MEAREEIYFPRRLLGLALPIPEFLDTTYFFLGKTHHMKTTKATASEIVEGMNVAARALGVSKDDIRQAKMDGAPGFRLGNRIDLAELRRYFVEKRNQPAPSNPLYQDGALAAAVEIMGQWNGPAGQAPISFTPAFTIGCWAVRGLVAIGGGEADVAAMIVAGFLKEIAEGHGNEPLNQDDEPEQPD